MSVLSEQTNYFWKCSKCASINQVEMIFCDSCAKSEGATGPESEGEKGQKSNKITQALAGAINWALSNGQIKAEDVVAQANKRGQMIGQMVQLQSLPIAWLDHLADAYVGSNRLGATGSGLGAGLPGGLAAFATIPADISAVIYFSMRCTSGISQSYGFETSSERGRTIQLLAFAQASGFETLVIGTRRLEIFGLARFLLDQAEVDPIPVKNCLLKALSAYLTVDFARTSWATFLPIIGGVVNGVDNFWYLGEVSKGSKSFYRTLLPKKAPAPTQVVTIEVRQERLEIAGRTCEVYLATGPQPDKTAGLVLVLWKQGGPQLAERLAASGLTALAVLETIDRPVLLGLLEWLQHKPPSFMPLPPSAVRPSLLASGEAAATVLQLLAHQESSQDYLSKVVLYNPVGPAHPTVTKVPLLLQWGEEAAEFDQNWADNLKAGTGIAIGLNPYAGVGADFATPDTSGYRVREADWAWTDSLEWLGGSKVGL